MSMNKVRLRIYGSDYFLTTDDDVQYMRNLGDEVDFVLSGLLREHPRLSITQAAVLCALQMADEKHKTEETSANLRSEIQAYMEDASKAKTEAEIAKREIDRLNKEIKALKNNRYE
ncbi:MAG: cell division protein ZapA [Clostridia bacterium]|nr:cell division protein ZapA [Clostridia bacterium]